MCGILGVMEAANSNTSDNNINKVIFEKALKTLSHRGPDASGIYHSDFISLGHTRLSIVDLSNNAAQPMHFYDTNHIVQNLENLSLTHIDNADNVDFNGG